MEFEQFEDAVGVFERVGAAADGAADRAGLDAATLDADVHFRRRGDKKLAGAEINQRAVGCRIGLFQPLKHGARRVGARAGEELAGDDLEQIAALERLLGLFDQRRVFAGRVVALGRQLSWRQIGVVGGLRRGARQTGGRSAAGRELVAVERGLLAHVVDDQDLVRQVKYKIALIVGTRQAQLHRLELEDEVVAEGAIEAEMLVFRALEQGDQRAQHREHRRLTAALLLGEACCRLADHAADASVARGAELDRVEAPQRVGDRRKQHLAAGVERLDRETAATRAEHQRRIDKAHVPAGVAAGKLEARREQHAALPVERLGEREIGGAVGARDKLALDRDPACGSEALALHRYPLSTYRLGDPLCLARI